MENQHYNKYKNRKTNVTYILVIVLISLISFFLFLKFFVLNTKSVSSNSQDMLCRSLMASKSLDSTKLAEFFYEINNKCHKDFIEEKIKSKDEAFKIIAESQKRCWYRYGESEYDFMSNFKKDGFWCFECAQIDFSSSNLNEIYSYNDYIEYLQNDKNKIKVGEEEKTYYEYMNLRYATIDEKGLYELRSNIDDLLADKDKNYESLAHVYNEQFLLLADLYKKQIDTDEKIYVVYRYDKPQEEFFKKVQDASYSAIKTTIGVAAIGFLVEKGISIVITGTVCLTSPTGVGAFLCAGAVAHTSAKIVKEGAEITTKTSKLLKNLDRIEDILKNGITFSKKSKTVSKVFTNNVDDLAKIGEDISKIDPKLGAEILDTHKSLKSLEINHLDDIKVESLNTDIKIKALDELYNKKFEYITSDDFYRHLENRDFFLSQKDELIKLREKIVDLEKKYSSLDVMPEDKRVEILMDKSTLLKGTIALTAGVASGALAYNDNENENQYVDLLTEEQYYRLCGTRSYSDNEK